MNPDEIQVSAPKVNTSTKQLSKQNNQDMMLASLDAKLAKLKSQKEQT